jgi:hypothetical protein
LDDLLARVSRTAPLRTPKGTRKASADESHPEGQSNTYQITIGPGINITALHTTSRDIRRHKASNYGNER